MVPVTFNFACTRFVAGRPSLGSVPRNLSEVRKNRGSDQLTSSYSYKVSNWLDQAHADVRVFYSNLEAEILFIPRQFKIVLTCGEFILMWDYSLRPFMSHAAAKIRCLNPTSWFPRHASSSRSRKKRFCSTEINPQEDNLHYGSRL